MAKIQSGIASESDGNLEKRESDWSRNIPSEFGKHLSDNRVSCNCYVWPFELLMERCSG